MNKLEVSEIEVIKKAKELAYTTKLKECIAYVNEVDINRSFLCHQYLQLYRGFSLFESQQIKDAFDCFEKIISESQTKKNGQVDEIDVFTRIIYQHEIFYFQTPMAEDQNHKLFTITEKYKEQKEKSEDYKEGMYLLGQGAYIFIETTREGVNHKCFQLLEKALYMLEDYRQEIMLYLGWCYYNSQEYEKSSKHYESLYKLNPRFPSVANNYALVLKELNEEDYTIEKLYLQEEEMRGYNQVLLNNMAQFYQSIEKEERQKECMEKMYSLTPKTTFIYCQYGQYIFRQGEKEEGIKIVQKAFEIDFNQDRIYECLSDLEIEMEDYEQALQHCLQCVKNHPKDGYFQYKLGCIYELMNQDDPEIARQRFQESIILKNFASLKIYAHSKIANSYLYEENYTKGLEELINTCNYKSNAHYLLSFDLQSIGEYLKEEYGIPLKTIIELINKQDGYFVTRFQELSDYMQDNNLKNLLLYKLDILRNILTLSVYSSQIAKELSFKSLIQFWDLYIN